MASGSSGVVSRTADRAARRFEQARHQIHQRRLARSVRPDEARDAGIDLQVDAIDAEHLTIEFRDVLEDDHVICV
jgi:hypothetical protein